MNISRREREKMQRRENLLEAAERVFGRKPYGQATMREVAAEAEIGMQGLYEHFPSKQDLYEQLLLQRARTFQLRADAVLAGIDDPLEQLRALATVYAELFDERPMFLPTFLLERVHFDWGLQSRFGPRIRPIFERERRRLTAILERAVRGGRLRPLPPDFLAQLWLGALQASLSHRHRHAPKEEVSTCVNRALQSLIEGAGP